MPSCSDFTVVFMCISLVAKCIEHFFNCIFPLSVSFSFRKKESLYTESWHLAVLHGNGKPLKHVYGVPYLLAASQPQPDSSPLFSFPASLYSPGIFHTERTSWLISCLPSSLCLPQVLQPTLILCLSVLFSFIFFIPLNNSPLAEKQ